MTTATQTTAPTSYTCVVSYNKVEMVIFPATNASKKCVINLGKLPHAGLTPKEEALVNEIQGVGVENEEYLTDLTVEEMQTLVSVRTKCSAVPSTKDMLEDKAASTINKGISNKTNFSDGAITSPETAYAEFRISQLNNVVSASTKQYVFLQYDIPSNNSKLYNPSHVLWFHGFRMTESCWCLPEERLEQPSIRKLVALWEKEGARYDVVEFSEKAHEKIRNMAEKKLHEELVRQHTSLITRIANANDRLAQAQKDFEEALKQDGEVTSAQQTEVLKKRDTEVRSIITTAGKHLNAAISCAEVFDTSDQVHDLMVALREAIKAEAQAFNAEAKVKGIKPAPLP